MIVFRFKLLGILLSISLISNNALASSLHTNSFFIKELTVSPHTCTLSSSASNTKTFTISSNLSVWEIESSQPSWLTVSKWSGSYNATITIIVTANTTASIRTGVITVSGAGVDSQTITVTQNSTSTSIDEFSNNPKLTLFPNPNNGKFTVNIDNLEDKEVSIKIINSVGFVVEEQKILVLISPLKKNFDISNLSRGLYLFEIETKKHKIVKSLILTK